MRSIEETGRNIEEATQKALEQLGVTEDRVDVEILEEGTRGFLGIGQAPARVRVTLKEAPREEPRQPRPRRQPRQRPERKPEQKPEGRPEQKPEARPEGRPEARPEARPGPRPERRRRPRPAPAPEPKPEEKPVAEITTPEPAREPAVEETKVPAAAPQAAEEAALTPETTAEAAEFGRDLLQRILDALGNGGTAVLRSSSGGMVVLDIEGGDAPRIIGKHGQTINAMQYLVGIALNRKYHGKLRTTLDAEGYRERREDVLHKQAISLARQVKENGQEAVLDALDANERRIIHTALANDPDVYTYSEGEEPERHLVISPKR